jgi:diguanylate cyclase (GGDEF)-like protein
MKISRSVTHARSSDTPVASSSPATPKKEPRRKIGGSVTVSLLGTELRQLKKELRKVKSELTERDKLVRSLQIRNDELAYENRRFAERIGTDSLTRLSTKLGGIEKINRLINRTLRDSIERKAAYLNDPKYRQRKTDNEKYICMLFCDIDHFGDFNKRFSFQEGNKVLRSVGDVIQANIRAGDVAVRMGGEEITILGQSLDGKDALVFANRVREAIAAQSLNVSADTILAAEWAFQKGSQCPADIVLPNKMGSYAKGTIFDENTTIPIGSRLPKGLEYHVTISIGVVLFRANCEMLISSEQDFESHEHPISKVLWRADRGLRSAKNGGRNRCCLGPQDRNNQSFTPVHLVLYF